MGCYIGVFVPFSYVLPPFMGLFAGDLPSLQIETVETSSIGSLSDTLCAIILNLGRLDVPANVTSIKSAIKLHCQRLHTQAPSDQVVFETLNTLLTEKKLHLTGRSIIIIECMQANTHSV